MPDETELDDLDERVMLAHGWQKLPFPAVPRFQRPTPNGVECAHHVNRYSSDWRAAGELYEEMEPHGICQLSNGDGDSVDFSFIPYQGEIIFISEPAGTNKATVITLAYLAWKEPNK